MDDSVEIAVEMGAPSIRIEDLYSTTFPTVKFIDGPLASRLFELDPDMILSREIDFPV